MASASVSKSNLLRIDDVVAEKLKKDIVQLLQSGDGIFLFEDIWKYFNSFHKYQPSLLHLHPDLQRRAFYEYCPEDLELLKFRKREFIYLSKYKLRNFNKFLSTNWSSIINLYKNGCDQNETISNNDDLKKEKKNEESENDVRMERNKVTNPSNRKTRGDKRYKKRNVAKLESDVISQGNDHTRENSVSSQRKENQSESDARPESNEERHILDLPAQVPQEPKKEELSKEELQKLVESLLQPAPYSFPLSPHSTPLYNNRTDRNVGVRKDEINTMAQDCISWLIENKQHVCPETVTSKLFEVCQLELILF